MAWGATCVQRLDGSRDSAIHTKYRISLRSSSMREPRYPLPRVVLDFGERRRRTPSAHRVRGVGGALSRWIFLGAARAGVRCFAAGDRDGSRPRGGRGPATLARARVGPPPRVSSRVRGSFCWAGFDNDPSAGSPTETLLRLLLPLNDKVQWTSRDVAGSEPPASPRSEHFTGPFNR